MILTGNRYLIFGIVLRRRAPATPTAPWPAATRHQGCVPIKSGMAAAPRSTPALVHFRPCEGALQAPIGIAAGERKNRPASLATLGAATLGATMLDAKVLGLATLGVTSVKNNGQVLH